MQLQILSISTSFSFIKLFLVLLGIFLVQAHRMLLILSLITLLHITLYNEIPGLRNSISLPHICLLLLSLFLGLTRFSFSSLITASISLCLGGLWASTELNWGGWWNWDSIEVPLLTLFVFVGFIWHRNTTSHLSRSLVSRNYVTVAYYFITWYVFSRSSSGSIHSFVEIGENFHHHHCPVCLFGLAPSSVVWLLGNAGAYSGVKPLIVLVTVFFMRYSVLFYAVSHHYFRDLVLIVLLLNHRNSLSVLYFSAHDIIYSSQNSAMFEQMLLIHRFELDMIQCALRQVFLSAQFFCKLRGAALGY